MPDDRGDAKVLPLWEHVIELANLLRTWVYTFILASMAFMVIPADLSFLKDPLAFYNPLVSVILLTLKNRLLPSNVQLIAGSFTAPIELYVIASVVLGFAVSLPLLAFKVYRFVDPALKPSERQSVYPFTAAFSLLFVAGVLFGFLILLPFIVIGTLIFLPVVGAAPFVNIEDFYTLVFFTLLTTGFAFTLPVFVVLLVKFQIIGTSGITKRRVWVWVGTYILTAVITPDGGPIADVALFIPIIILLEGSLLVARRYEKRHPLPEKKREHEALKCRFCNGVIDPEGVFCGLCGKSRL
ncbi:hypothetical protein E6H36_10230 [Candidatus Bathyarchaeota archaeon]|nr:MAG: hypothetical protein E6H36_10230 [Candidatus Bathyarchaeota archaeon]TMI29880.1 MAG: hypothetical protein E6H29_09915 [Candidatus Bathyarchaeota archaeon]